MTEDQLVILVSFSGKKENISLAGNAYRIADRLGGGVDQRRLKTVDRLATDRYAFLFGRLFYKLKEQKLSDLQKI